ncbi:Cytidine deaminase, partial [Orpheovirus IHUMI-LCC2]
VKLDKSGTGKDNSKPCFHCLQKIKKTGIKRIFYGVGGKWICEKTRDMTTTHVSGFNKVRTKKTTLNRGKKVNK